MRFFTPLLLLFFTSLPNQLFALTDDEVAEITERVEAYSTDELVERKNMLEESLEVDEADEEDCAGDVNGNSIYSPDGKCVDAKTILLELSIIEQLLILAGVIVADNISDETVTPPDTIFPIITIEGDNPATVELGSTYTDAGATSDGGETVSSSGSVDTDTVGTYTITYSASDAAGNTSTATRTVNVVDTTAPVVTLTGAASVTVELGGTYTELGATATDASGTVTVVDSGVVDSDIVGTYTVTYTSTDASGNAGTATRTVNVVDTTAPVFTSTASFSAQENQTSIGTVTVTDLQTITFTISGSDIVISSSGVLSFVTAPDFETQTSFLATVTATDASSNVSTQDITVTVTNDESDDEDDDGTGTGTGTGTGQFLGGCRGFFFFFWNTPFSPYFMAIDIFQSK